MKTEKDLKDDILKTTMTIQEKFPELSKYIVGMPDTIPDSDDPEINAKILKEYSDSLESLVKKYAPSHNGSPK